mmetsp:Transcript_70227/g.155315  ORF Transcript_70227/g.155315 Transcript_70227/m.155315 type:complete len:294 (-) Transcript_70227:161-1042(-)
MGTVTSCPRVGGSLLRARRKPWSGVLGGEGVLDQQTAGVGAMLLRRLAWLHDVSPCGAVEHPPPGELGGVNPGGEARAANIGEGATDDGSVNGPIGSPANNPLDSLDAPAALMPPEAIAGRKAASGPGSGADSSSSAFSSASISESVAPGHVDIRSYSSRFESSSSSGIVVACPLTHTCERPSGTGQLRKSALGPRGGTMTRPRPKPMPGPGASMMPMMGLPWPTPRRAPPQLPATAPSGPPRQWPGADPCASAAPLANPQTAGKALAPTLPRAAAAALRAPSSARPWRSRAN